MKLFRQLSAFLLILFLGISFVSCELQETEPAATHYNVTFSASPKEGGTVLPESSRYAFGDTVNFSAQPADGWHFDHWEENYQSEQPSGSVVVNGDMKIIAFFKKGTTVKQYTVTLTASPAQGGSVTPESGTYPAGSSIDIEAIANQGWHFDHWEGDYQGADRATTIKVDAKDMQITAVFTQGEQPVAEGTITIGNSAPFHFASLTPTGYDQKEQQLGSDFIPAASFYKDELGLNFIGSKTTSADYPAPIIRIKVDGVTKPGTYPIISDDLESTPEATGFLFGDVIDGNYRTDRNTDGNMDGGKKGGGQVIVTSLTKDRIKGTFTLTMYGRYGEKATVREGRFNARVSD